MLFFTLFLVGPGVERVRILAYFNHVSIMFLMFLHVIIFYNFAIAFISSSSFFIWFAFFIAYSSDFHNFPIILIIFDHCHHPLDFAFFCLLAAWLLGFFALWLLGFLAPSISGSGVYGFLYLPEVVVVVAAVVVVVVLVVAVREVYVTLFADGRCCIIFVFFYHFL